MPQSRRQTAKGGGKKANLGNLVTQAEVNDDDKQKLIQKDLPASSNMAVKNRKSSSSAEKKGAINDKGKGETSYEKSNGAATVVACFDENEDRVTMEVTDTEAFQSEDEEIMRQQENQSVKNNSDNSEEEGEDDDEEGMIMDLDQQVSGSEDSELHPDTPIHVDNGISFNKRPEKRTKMKKKSKKEENRSYSNKRKDLDYFSSEDEEDEFNDEAKSMQKFTRFLEKRGYIKVAATEDRDSAGSSGVPEKKRYKKKTGKTKSGKGDNHFSLPLSIQESNSETTIYRNAVPLIPRKSNDASNKRGS